MKSFILSIFLAADISTAFEFERMKLRSNYPEDLKSAKDFIILWASYDDIDLYEKLKKEYPNAIHSYHDCKELQIQPSVVIGNSLKQQVRVISAKGDVKINNCPDGRCPLIRKP